MPEISRFFGIIITMYWDDHNSPHFHAKHGEFSAKFTIETGELMDGNLSKRDIRLVQAWTELHKDELMYNWKESQKDNPNFITIAPLR
ncbi:MAG: DUF4160 domain-containing protein [Ignavibacteriaceae bacterium]|nr:DUF4160 domain-containing protein [Ignavibacteriaceae bacterium]